MCRCPAKAAARWCPNATPDDAEYVGQAIGKT